MNSVILIGRLTRDPELRYTSGTQMAVATFTVAIDRPVRAGAEKQTDFPRVTVFGKQAENCEKYLAEAGRAGAVSREGCRQAATPTRTALQSTPPMW